MRRSVIVCTLVAALGLSLATASAAAAGESPSPTRPDDETVYRIGTTQDYDGFNPFAHWAGVSWDCFRVTYNFLTWYNESYEPVPDLATGWSTSADGKVWTFTIREGMVWHDGEPVTAHDVAFTYNYILDTEAWAYTQYLVGVEKVEAPDDTTLVITCEKPNAGMLALYIPILPEHIWKDVSADEQETFKNLPIVGSGPFRVVAAKKGRWVKLAPNPAYPEALGGPPKIDALYWVIFQNMDAMVQDYKAGNLDAIVEWPASYYQDLRDQPGGTACAAPYIGFHELGFNCWKDPKSKGDPLLRDAAVRTAIHWAIDKQAIVAAAMSGLAVPGDVLVSPVQALWRWEPPEDQRYSYDPERARQILEDAGYRDADGDGVREDSHGDKLDFRLTVFNEYPEDQAAAKKIVSWCADVGIRLRLDVKDEGAFTDQFYDSDYDCYVWSWGGDIDPGFMLSVFTTEQIFNWSDSQYSNPEYDRLYVQQAQAVDPDDPDDRSLRKAVVDEMQAILYRDNPYIILWYGTNLQAWRTDKWTGYHYVPPGGGGAPFWNMMRTTYQDLEPVSAAATATTGTATEAWVAVVVAVIVVAAIVVWLLKRPKKAEVE